MSYRAKKAFVEASLLMLGVGFEMVSKHSVKLKDEIADWEDGRIFSLGVMPNGPAISLKKVGDRIRYLGKGQDDAEIKFLFKNIDSALLLTTSRMGSHTAFAQRRSIVHGSIAKAVQVSRAMAIVQSYLLPGFVLNRTCKRPPKLTPTELLLKMRVAAMLPIGILIKMRR